MKPSIAFFDTKPFDRDFFPNINKRYGYAIDYFENKLTPKTVKLANEHTVICPFVNDTLSAEVIEELHRIGIKLIALRSAGYNHVDLKAAQGKIPVVRVPAYSPRAVAEHAAALMMTLNRKTHRAYYRIRDNNFAISGLMGFDMYGKTAGVIGTGKIGKAIIEILRGFGMTIVAYDAYPDDSYAQAHGFEYHHLDTLYKESDIITLHCPLTPDTKHMINKKSIDTMKKGVMIINTGRGALIDSRDLVEGLKSGSIGSAGLDVYEEESDYFFEDYSSMTITDDILARFLTFPNVLITSHQGFFTREALTAIAETTLENIKLFFEKNELPNEVCAKCG
ncbi:MAG: 2-hydroxyacid dehydrogenase [Chitinivibrionales bacterium]|nr:2-hydroxyacid dehydrogenase [Chitinivibrionales bacterium]